MCIKAYVLKPYVLKGTYVRAVSTKCNASGESMDPLQAPPKMGQNRVYLSPMLWVIQHCLYIYIYYSMSSPKITLSILGHQIGDRNH